MNCNKAIAHAFALRYLVMIRKLVKKRSSVVDYTVRHAVMPNVQSTVVAFLSVIAILVASEFLDFEVNLKLYSLPILFLGPATILVTLLGACLWVLFRERPEKPTFHLLGKMAGEWKCTERLFRGAPTFLLFPLFFGAFTSYKSALGKLVPFYFDPYAVKLDRWLHGTDPWILLQAVVGFPFATFLLNFFYNLWFLILYIQLAFVMFLVSDIRLRTQYLTAFVLSWMLVGVVAATLLSSAGPCYYDAFFEGSPYQDLIAYLDGVRQQYYVPARELQPILLESYLANALGVGRGISAAPSMHVAVAVLNAILLSKYGRSATVIGCLYVAIILVGSVHLGWHYAIDGYISGIMVVLIWKFSGFLTDWFGTLSLASSTTSLSAVEQDGR